MADRSAEFLIRFEGDDTGSVRAVLAALKRDIKAGAQEMARATEVEMFAKVKEDAKTAAQAFFDAKKRVDDLRTAIKAIEDAGGNVGKDLAKQMREAEKALAAATKEFDKQKGSLKDARANLEAAEKASAELAEEQTRLAAAWKEQSDAAKTAGDTAAQAVASAQRLAQEAKAIGQAFQANKDALGLKTLKDIQPEIEKVRLAYQQLKESGKLSFGELSVASARAEQRIAALKTEASGVGDAFKALRAQAAVIVGSLTAIGAAAFTSARNYREFAQQVAAVDSIAGVSAREMENMADGVRRLAREMGVNAVESAKALYEIISSGIPANNALTVLEQSTQAAIAGLTSVDTAARVGVGVLNAYGKEIGELGNVFDVLFKVVQDGVISFPDLANNIGEVIPTARAAKVSLEEIGAAFVVLTRNGVGASESATQIRSAIQALTAPAPEAAERMGLLNIELGNFTNTLRQIAERGLSLPDIRRIVPDARAARAVLTMSQNIKLLNDEIGELNNAAGTAEAAYKKLANTPQARVNAFQAALRDLSITFGEFVTNATDFVRGITNVVNSFNALDASTRQAAFRFASLTAAFAGLAFTIRTLSTPLNLFVGSLTQSIPLLSRFTMGLTAAQLAMRGLAAAAAGFTGFELGTWLRENVPLIAQFGDLLGTAFGATMQSAGLVVDGFGAALGLTGESLSDVRDRGRRFTDYMRAEFSNAMSGATQRIRELEKAQKNLSDEFGRAIDKAGQATAALQSTVGALATNVRTQLEGVEQTIQLLEQRLNGIVGKMGETVQAAQQIGEAALGNISARVQSELAALETLSAGEVQRAQAAVEIQRKAAAERLAVIQQYSKDALAAFDAEAKGRMEIAKRSGEDLKRLEATQNAGRRDLLNGILAQYRAHFQQLIGLEAQHVQNLRAIEEQRRNINASVEEKIREAKRVTLTEAEKYADRVKQIDELLSKARQALMKGDNKLAEELAQKAIAFTDQIAGEVKDGERIIVSAQEASNKAIGKYQESLAIVNRSLGQRAEAEKAGAAAAGAAADQTKAKMREVEAEVSKLQAQAEKGIQLRIDADTTALDDTLRKLDEATAEQTRLIKINADVTLAMVEIERLRTDLEKGVTVNVEARTDEIEQAIKRIDEAEPTLNVDVDKALEQIGEVQKAAKAIENVRMKITSNAAEVQKEIDNLKLPTESVHTIRVRRVEENAAGGLVGGAGRGPVAARGFARGGAVFRRPSWAKVPGTGNQDTVPAKLRAGSFVVRKAAVQKYGDGVMRSLVRGQPFAVGGIASRILGGNARASELARRLFGGRKRPGEAGSADIGSGGGEGLFGLISDAYRVIQPLLDGAKTLPRSRTGQNLGDYLQAVLDIIQNTSDIEEARTLLENIRAMAKNLMASIVQAHRMRVPIVMGAQSTEDALLRPRPVAKGGPAGTDTVPAWLTPGEWVIPRRAVQHYGQGLLEAVNGMRISPEVLHRMVEPPPRVHRFAAGGPVPGAPTPPQQFTRPRGESVTVNVNANAGDLLNEANVRRFIIPVLNDIQRRSR